MIRFACPGCQATFTVGVDRGGKVTRCPKCQTKFLIPEPDPGAAGDAPPALPSSASSPSPPPPPGSANEPVEIAPCPGCKTRLSVMPTDLGLDVECPTCQTTFKAMRPGSAPPAPPPAPPRRSALESTDDTGAPESRRRVEDDEEDDRPSRRKRRDEDDEEDDRPSKRRRRDEEEEDRPSRRKSRRSRRDYEPHRGALILTLGILGFVGCGIFTALPAMIMGGSDLRKIDNGTMDPEGRQLTQIGRILGMVSTILTVIGLLAYCLIFVIAIGAGAGGGMKGR